MNPPQKFSIDLNEEFPTLASSPSIEAVIHWQVPAKKTLDFTTLQAELSRRLPDYPICQPMYDFQVSATGSIEGSIETSQRNQWSGFRLQDEQARHVAQFTQAGVVFSRLAPYEEWNTFQSEAMRFWEVFVELAAPAAIDRLGVRYINRILLGDGELPSLYLKSVPSSLSGVELPNPSFFYQDLYQVPGYPYSIDWVRTIQPEGVELGNRRALLVDIDVFITDLLDFDQRTLARRLLEMRWLKNKFFFSCMTQSALERFGA
ncbi:MAG: TIGR04255 family protein [Oculatellaceae cyanobacterium Prado106]|nr:TIGR04255 family protein [Oculatellaceae cyanobacterium Prado106]